LSWSDDFEDLIPGLGTLRDAADYIQKLPKAQQNCRTGRPPSEPESWPRKAAARCRMLASVCIRAMSQGVERVVFA
jgi:hypothetical protein